MSYLLKSKQRRNSTPRIVLQTLLFSAGALVFVFFARTSVVFLYEKIVPLRYAVDTSVGYVQNLFVTKYALEHKIQALEDENAGLQAKITELIIYERFAHEFGSSTSSSRVSAFVVSRPPFVPYDLLLLNKGSEDRVEVGQRVFENITHLPIGTISEVTKYAAYATLFSKPDNSLEIAVGTSSTLFEAKGSGGGSFEAKIPKALNVSIGDTVRIPKQSLLPYSTVKYVQSSDSNPFVLLQFRLPVDFNSLESVTIEQ